MYLADEVCGDIQDAGTLITWDSAVTSLKGVMESHFADYTGYNSVEFNDVRLTYFRIKTGDGEYEAIPVYSFAQLDSDHSDTYPIQLVLIDARMEARSAWFRMRRDS